MKKSILALLIATSFVASANDDYLNNLINGDIIAFDADAYITNNNLPTYTFNEFTKSKNHNDYYNNNLVDGYINVDFNTISSPVSSMISSSFKDDMDDPVRILTSVQNMSTQNITGINVNYSYNSKHSSIDAESILKVSNSENIKGGVYGLSSYTINGDLKGSIYFNNVSFLPVNYSGSVDVSGILALDSRKGFFNGNIVIQDSIISGNFYGVYLETSDVASRAIGDSFATDNILLKVNSDIYVSNVSLNGFTSLISQSTNSLLDGYGTIPLESSGNISIFNNFNTNGYKLYIGNINYNEGYFQNQRGLYEKNNLNIGSTPFSATNVEGFKNYNFYINNYNYHVVNTSDYILTTDKLAVGEVGTVIDYENGNLSPAPLERVSKIEIKGISGKYNPVIGDKIGLIKVNEDVTRYVPNEDASNVSKDDSITHFFGETEQGSKINYGLTKEVTVKYEFDDVNKTAIAIIDKIEDKKQEDIDTNVKPLAEGRLSALMNATRNIDDVNSMLGKNELVGTFTPMAKISGGINKYGNSNNNVDSNDYRLIIGSRYQVTSNFYAGLTAEYGISNYSTNNSFTTGDVNGSGNAKSYGVTLFAKYSNESVYTKAGLGFGRSSNEYRSNDVVTGSGESANYDSKANYVNAFAGVGYVYDINETFSIDSSATYYFTKLNNDSVVIDGEAVKFKNSTSSRVNVREALQYKAFDNGTAYVALAFEHEFDSKAKATVNGKDVTTDAKGSTGIMELGLKGTPTSDKDFELDFNVKGYGGERKGITASIYAQYNF